MPVPITASAPAPLFPPITKKSVDAARTSSWHEIFEDITAPAVVIDLEELGEREAFTEWIDSESIFLPEGSERPSSAPASTSDASGSTETPVYRLPKLNEAIRDVVKKYGAVFPKLNWTAPRDAAFLLPQGHGPLHCSTPADVYLLLKSSDFVAHGLGERAYEGAEDETEKSTPRLELVLKKFTEMNPSREFRCFVRDNILIGISQRDMNFYDHLQTREAQQKVVDTVRSFWEDEIRDDYPGGDDYIFDLYLGDHQEPTIIDFQPYRQSTDSLLFAYEDLQNLLARAREPQTNSAGDPISGSSTPVGSGRPSSPELGRLPVLRVVDSASHPAASRAAPTFSTNMMPLEMLEMSDGRTLAEFAQAWEEAMNAGNAENSDDEPEVETA